MSRRENPEYFKNHTVNYLIARKKHLGTPLPGQTRRPASYQRRAALAASEIIRIAEQPVLEFLAQSPATKGREARRLLREALDDAVEVVRTYKPPYQRPAQPPLRAQEMRAPIAPQPTEPALSQEVEVRPDTRRTRAAKKVRKAAVRFKEDPRHRKKVLFSTGKAVVSGVAAAMHLNVYHGGKLVYDGVRTVSRFLQDNPVPQDSSTRDRIIVALDRALLLNDEALKQITEQRRDRRSR